MTERHFRSRWLYYVLALLIFVGGVILWTSNLACDPPLFFSGASQSLSTDPAHCVYHARNYALYGDSDPFDYTRWLVFQRSLVSLVAHVWFSARGVSYQQAGAVGVLLSLGALVFFAAALLRHHRPWTVAAVVLVYVMNINLIVHGRLPYLENGLLFISSLLFLVHSRWWNKRWGQILSGAIVAAAMLMGKLFGLLLLPALLLAQWFSTREDRSRRAVATLVGFAAAVVILVLVLFGTNLSDPYRYFGEQSYGLRGFPQGLTSPWGFFEHLISYGFDNRLFYLGIDLLVFLWLSGFLLTHFLAARRKLEKLSPVTLLALFAVGCIILGLMPLNYSPVRYGVFLVPAIILLFFSLIDYLLKADSPVPKRAGYSVYTAFFLLAWQAVFHLIGLLFFVNDVPTRPLVWASLPVAVAITLLVRYLMKGRAIGRRALYTALGLTLVFSVAFNAYRLSTVLMPSTDTNIEDANRDLQDILGEDAVVSGPYAPILTINNDIKSFIHMFGVAKVDATLFHRYPITHLLIDSSNHSASVQSYPVLTNMAHLTVYWIGEYVVRVASIAGLFPTSEARNYRETAYESAMRFYLADQRDSALVKITEFLSDKPLSRSGNLLLAQILMDIGRADEAAVILTDLAARHPFDYYSNVVCGQCYQIMGLQRRDTNLLLTAQKYYLLAVHDNKFKADHARYIYESTERQYGGADKTKL